MPGLLVADDTALIRSTIKRVVNRENLGFQPVLEAANGEEAVALARQHKPDIVLMDIKMPGLDGLQAAAIIRREFPATKIIILTAYDDFPYVQKALKLGAVDYLLKPIRPDKLAAILTQVYDQFQQEQQQLQNASVAKNYLQETLPMIENSLVERLVRGLVADKAAIKDSLKHLGKTISWPMVIVADVEGFEALGSESTVPAPLSEVTPHILGGGSDFLVGLSNPGRVIAIVSTGHTLAAVDQTRQLGAGIQQALQTRLGLSVNVGLGHRYADIESIPLSYAEASLACRHHICQTQQRVIHIDDINQITCREKLAYPVQLERKILDNVRQINVKECMALLNDMLDYLVYQFKKSPEIIRNRLGELMALVTRIAIKAGAPETEMLDHSHEQVMALATVQKATDMRSWAANSLAEILAAIPTPLSTGSDAVQQAIDYIHRRQHQPDITLNEVADAVGLSASHLASQLKCRVGMSYKRYLIALRLDTAKKLLRTTNMTVTAIAEAVGYQNVTNFYRLFQRETGTTPAAFRRTL
jgi:two-component system response regulator YesN